MQDDTRHRWAVILAGGQGRRMRHLTIGPDGLSVPKQFCSLGRGNSLLHDALHRAGAIAPPERILVSVTEGHRAWWAGLTDCMPPGNVIVQPEQRGTGIGMLQPLLEILRRDPQATVAFLPADHYFRRESMIDAGLREAMTLAAGSPDEVLLLGFKPDDADPDLGYIVPDASENPRLFHVRQFVEKPGDAHVQALIDRGALWNSFIVVAHGRALRALFERRFPAALALLQDYVARSADGREHRALLLQTFRDLPPVDFSDDVIPSQTGHLRVLALPACGWSDLGTPARLARVLRRHRKAIDQAPCAPPGTSGHVDLARANP
jgi:mannose-1-phosphate guanylyltransferase